MSPSVTAGGSGGGGSMQEVHALRAPRLEVDLGGVSLEHGGSAQDRATNGNGRRDRTMELDPNTTPTSAAFTSIQTAAQPAVDVGGPPANPEAPSPPQQLQPQQPDVEIEVSEDEADGFGTHPWIYSCLPSYRAAEPHAQATAQGSTTYIQRLN